MPKAPTHPARSFGKHPGGRPSKYDPSHPNQLISFFSQHPAYQVLNGVRVPSDPPVLLAFAAEIGVGPPQLYDWEKIHPEFHEALDWWRAFSHLYLLTCGLLGLTNPTITQLELKNNHGYRDRHEVNGNGLGGETHYHYTVNVQANEDELARGILAAIRNRTPTPAA